MNTVTFALLSLILLGAVISFYRRKIFRTPMLRFFFLFLLFQFAYQLGAYLYSFVWTAHAPNYFIFNLALPINTVYFGLIFHEIIRRPLKRRIIVAGTAANLLFYLINLFFLQGFFELMTYSRTVMAATLVGYALLYFHELLTSEDQDEINPMRNVTFWIVTAVFFFYLCSTLTIITWDYLRINNEIIGPMMVRIFGFFLYVLYIIGFILHKEEPKSIT